MLCADESLVVVRRRVNEMAEDFLRRPDSRLRLRASDPVIDDTKLDTGVLDDPREGVRKGIEIQTTTMSILATAGRTRASTV